MLKDIITEKYGVKPVSKHKIPPQYKNTLLEGIKNGAISLSDEWTTPKTFITLKMVCNKNGYINTSVTYLEKEYKELIDSIKKNENKKDNVKKDIKKEKESLKKYF